MTSIDTMTSTANLIRNGPNRATGRDPLPRLLTQLVARAGEPVMIERAASRPWASALFQGRRHVVTLRLTGADAVERRARFVSGIEEAEWTLTGHFVADITVDDQRSAVDEEWIELSALTIEDW